MNQTIRQSVVMPWVPVMCRPAAVANDPSSGPHLTDLLADNSWKPHLADEFQKPYFHKLEKFIQHEWKTQQVFPTSSHIFRYFILACMHPSRPWLQLHFSHL